MKDFVSARLIASAAGGLMLSILAWPASSQTAPNPYTDVSSWTDISTYLLSPSAQAPAVQGTNSSTIIQNGTKNTATVSTTVPSYVGTGSYYGNVTSQTQIGSDNVSTLRAVGNNNTLTSSQTGDGNSTSITAYGSNNSYSSTQNGSNLSYTLHQVGNGRSVSVSQTN